ncbi:hypothetical protein OCK74_22700 [Chitinophagaceae bacterium LB-8]|uniref:Uncharacterized protein n=1 Tax=Paraflavisolibacter caeni TaxID=2982496 RepID=A0A9X3BIU2_9BACT|nr:hypothetical protein [Paraflavisolibacter caeni]MCU7551947.1 hypothetical protein [Paraflavisolibacter caeni]
MKKNYLIFAFLIILFSCQTNPEAKPEEVGSTSKEENNLIPFADTLSANWIVVKASVFNKPAFLLLDNGTIPETELILFKHYATAKSVIDSTKPFWIEMKRIAKSPASIFINHFSDTVNTELQPVYNAPVHKMPDGILGKGFLTKYVLEVDYNNKTLNILDSSGYIVPEGYKAIQMKPAGYFYKFSADLFLKGNKIQEDLYLDLGSGLNGFLFGFKFYRKNKDKLAVDTRQIKESHTMFSKSKVANIIVDSVKINGVVLKNILSSVEVESTVSFTQTLIGNSVLRHFGKVIFNLGNNKMYLPMTTINVP